MPPKKAPKGEQKKKMKAVEDKTFGMKNKKGKKGQDAIKKLTSNMNGGATKAQRQKMADNELKAKAKEQRAREKDMLGKLFAPVQNKAKKGEDPGSIVCAFFKAGNCAKGAKCKFSHNLAVQRKGAKINAYEDRREEKEADKMETWDADKLLEVVKNKHGKQVVHPTTNIICKFFVDALENDKYGWFWVCPNDGDKCKYRHALPEGYVLKKDRKRIEALKDQLTIEELVDQEREALGENTTKVTLESFTAWKKKKVIEKKKAAKAAKKDKKEKIKQGGRGGLTGRDMFSLGAIDVDALDESGAADVVVANPPTTDATSAEATTASGKAEPKVFDANIFQSKEEEEEEEAADEGVPAAAAQEAASVGGPTEAPAAAAAPAAAVDENLFGDDLGLEGLDLED